MSKSFLLTNRKEAFYLAPRQTRRTKMERWQIGYLAGMVDAEFHIGIQREFNKARRRSPTFSIRVELAMTTKSVVDFVNSLLPNGKRISIATKGRRLAVYRLRLVHREAIQFLKTVLPYLQGRKRQAEICIKMDALRQSLTPPKQHFGAKHFHRLPIEYVKRAEKLFKEFRSLQLNKKTRKK